MAVSTLEAQGIALEMGKIALEMGKIAMEIGEIAARACAQRDTLDEIAQTWASIAAEHAEESAAKERQIEQLREALRFLLVHSYDGNLDAATYERLDAVMRGT